MKNTESDNGGSLERMVRRRGRRGRMKRGWNKQPPPRPRQLRNRPGDVWVEIFLPPAFDGDVMVSKRLNLSSGSGLAEWHWWNEIYHGVKPPNDPSSATGREKPNA